MRHLIVMLLAALTSLGTVASGDLPHYTGDELAALFERADRDAYLEPGEPPAITAEPSVDAMIRRIAEEKGYSLQPVSTGELVAVDGHFVHPDVAAAWRLLQAEAAAAGHHIVVMSGFRSVADQRVTFLSKLGGYSETAIDSRLSWSAPPGYSKHHTGYAIDVAVAGSTFGAFGGTRAHEWMAADNFHNAKRFGFIPSYPPDGPPQGPNPEPWEWLYVGVRTVLCGGDGKRPPSCRPRPHSPARVYVQ